MNATSQAACFALVITALLTSCDHSPSIFLHRSASFFSLNHGLEMKTLREIHLDGSGLINSDVMVSGKLKVLGTLGTYVVIEEERVRLLIDLSKVAGSFERSKLKIGQDVEISGRIHSGAAGHIYLVASTVREV
jgi:hypothetical protein